MKVFLIGLPGSGKSTTGLKIAERLNLKFFDLDEEIVSSEGMPVTEIFNVSGESYFRERESKILQQVIENHPDFILATGGGTPCFFNNLELMKESGTVIFLNTSFDVITERLIVKKDSRPLIKDSVSVLDKLIDLFNSRKHYYEQAHYIVSSEEELLDIISQK